MSLKLEGRHYWSQAEYSRYGLLANDGSLVYGTGYSRNHNINYNSFNVYMNFVWQFKPGSEMSVVYQNSIYTSGQGLVSGYFDDLSRTVQAPQSNSLSLKIIYYLDYQTMEKVWKKS
jgi:opacity protein-like surface antigen